MTSTAPNLTSTSNQWIDAVRDDLQLVEEKMRHAAHMDHEILNTAVKTLISAGGKRLRPAVTLFGGRIFDVSLDDLVAVAASIELLHTATLVHDDLIDGADERRGAPTLHSRIPIGVTVLTGDFLFAQSAALAAEANSVAVVRLFADTLVSICKGEILQAQSRWKVPNAEVYEQRIYGKTAALFEAASTAAALLGQASEHEVTAMAAYGRELGLAFQIVDDALDFGSTTQTLGKPAGHDMRQGILNLPVMYYVQGGFISEGDLVERLSDEDDSTHADALVADIQKTGMVERSLDDARRHVGNAQALLKQTSGGPGADMLAELADYALARLY
jgi:geranylgeranyl pyrophosphate synthase